MWGFPCRCGELGVDQEGDNCQSPLMDTDSYMLNENWHFLIVEFYRMLQCLLLKSPCSQSFLITKIIYLIVFFL